MSLEHRKSRRYTVLLPAQLLILLPGEQSPPPWTQTVILNMSETGAMICLSSLTRGLASSLLQTTRSCRLDILEPPELGVRISGHAVWLQPENRGGECDLKIGLMFQPLPDEVAQRLHDYLGQLANED